MKWDIEGAESWGWKKHPAGAAVLEAGNAKYYKTGGWRTLRPVLEGRCNHCLQCWIFCPDSAVMVKDEKLVGFDLDHCKGCGICAESCALKAISMVDEQKAQEEGADG